MSIYTNTIDKFRQGYKSLAVLIDPDSSSDDDIVLLSEMCQFNGLDYIFIGGSVVKKDRVDHAVRLIKQQCSIPIIIFPGDTNQLSSSADGLLFLSLISGRNPNYLIGKQVESIPILRHSNVEIISTGYILVDGGKRTAVEQISQTTPIPRDQIDLAVNTALAGQYMGMKMIYLEAGSGAMHHVPLDMIRTVSNCLNVPLIVGGGIRSADLLLKVLVAGADLVVIGNVLEKTPNLLPEMIGTIKQFNSQYVG